MAFPPYLVKIGQALNSVLCSVQVYSKKVTHKQYSIQDEPYTKCYAYIPWLQHSSTINRKCNKIDTCLNASLNIFLSSASKIYCCGQKNISSELNKKINSCRNLNFAIQPACKKQRLVVYSDCRGNVANLRASGLCFLEQSPGPLIYPLQQQFS